MTTGTCIIKNKGTTHTHFVVFTRPPDEDQEAKQFNQAPGQCSVCLYGDVSFPRKGPVTAWHPVCLDQQSMSAILYSPDLYFHWHLPPGRHQINVMNAYMWDWPDGGYLGFLNRDEEDWKGVSKTLECEPGGIHFLGIEERSEAKKSDGHGLFATKYVTTEFSLESTSEEIGKANILDRDLASHPPASRLHRDADSSSLGRLRLECSVSEK